MKTAIAATLTFILCSSSAAVALPRGFVPAKVEGQQPSVDGLEPCRNLSRPLIIRTTQAVVWGNSVPECPVGEKTQPMTLDQHRRLLQGVYETEVGQDVDALGRAIKGNRR
jgi:hypothetical protein